MTTTEIERRFGKEFFENIAEFVAQHYSISDLDKEKEALDFVRGDYTPGQVFSERELNDWAEANGYEKVTP